MEPLQAIPPSPGSPENFFPSLLSFVSFHQNSRMCQISGLLATIGRGGRIGGRVGVFNDLSVFSE